MSHQQEYPELPFIDFSLVGTDLGTKIREAMRAFADATCALRSGWQPIETAPKGRKVLAGYFNKLGNWRTVMACYYLPQTLEAPDDIFDETSDGYAPEGWYEESESQESILPTDEPPTHWMPLPAAPSQRQQAQPSTGETK